MSKTAQNILTILCLTIISGCAGVQPQKQNIAQVTMPALQPASFERDLVKRDTESQSGIYNEMGSRDFFQDLRAYKVGDLVTVNIVETSSASKSATTQTGRSSSINAVLIISWAGKED